jgi:tetratricopeptide (TPR) repeat protein
LVGGDDRTERTWDNCRNREMARRCDCTGCERCRQGDTEKDWLKAARLYGEIVAKEPNPRAWYRLETSLNKIGEHEKAIEAFEKGSVSGIAPQFVEYGIAVVCASKGGTEQALEHLEKAAQNGFSQPEQLEGEVDLASVKSNPRFAKILEVVKRNPKPCAQTPENPQFDFWVGEWRVVTTQGESAAGEGKIDLILADCVLQENWTSSGNTGTPAKAITVTTRLSSDGNSTGWTTPVGALSSMANRRTGSWITGRTKSHNQTGKS